MTPQDVLQEVQRLDKYARHNKHKGRRETWEETTNRVVKFFMSHVKSTRPEAFDRIPWDTLKASLLNREALPSMRVVQMAGPPLERCNVGAYNCSYLPIDSINSFPELLYILMQGTGVGFSVETRHVDKLPRIRKQRNPSRSVHDFPSVHTIVDTTEGWCDALKLGLESWFNGLDVRFVYDKIRPQGAPLKTKGGRASGPGPLKQLLDTVRSLILARQGLRLTPLDCHDIACLCGSIVQVGGVRRAAEISLSDPDDHEMRHAKVGPFWETAPHRTMANNSAVYEEKPPVDVFMEEWLSLMKSGTGERGIFNREGVITHRPQRRKKAEFGVNPCGEIMLRPREFCNLSIAVARPQDTLASLRTKIKLATIWGTLQATLTNFNYIGEEWKKNCEEEALLGVDITGQMDCPLFLGGDTASILRDCKREVLETNAHYAEVLGINKAAATTCIKPSGNSSQLLDCASGLHPRYAKFYIRRLRIGAHTPIGQWLRAQGVRWSPEVGQGLDNMTVMVVDFPVKAPEGARTRHGMTALQQLEYWLMVKRNFVEHGASVTIYVGPDEWLEVGAWVYRNWDNIAGLSFLPKDGGIYQLAPYQEITEAEYNELAKGFPEVDFGALGSFESGDQTTVNSEFACMGGQCDV